ncbi:MAG TPA: type II toxin-antitoxin system Phd/YefM family antitoxin [Methylocystis sp.]|nr:type II toxin-antitoxin system Phd/YefM family antitoxin [Methylocystis sp.]
MPQIAHQKPRSDALAAESPQGPLQAWSFSDASERFPQVLALADEEGAQVITRDGRPVAVVVAFDEWECRTLPKDTLADFLIASPLRGSEIEIERDKEAPRDVDL